MKLLRKSNKFKDYIRKTFIYYIIILIILIFVLFILSIFFNFKATIVKTNKSYNRKLSNFIDGEYNSYKENINLLSEEPSIIKVLMDRKHLSQANNLLYKYSNEQKIRGSFVLLDEKGKIISTNLYKKNQALLSKSNLIRELILYFTNNPNSIFEDLNKIEYEGIQSSPYFFAKAIKIDKEIKGYLIFYLKGENFRQYVQYKDVDIAIITDKYDNVMFSTNDLVINNMGKMDIGNKNKSTTLFNERLYYVVLNEIQDKNIKILTMTSIDKYRQSLIIGMMFLLGISFLIIVLVTILSPKITERNLKSLDSLIFAIKQLKEGNIEYRIESKTFDEFQILYDEFNNMMGKIQLLIQRNDEIAERKRIMEIKHLESQFNPHFVYNVMEMLRYEILFDPKLASNMVVSFANLMRYNANYGNVEIPLKTDIEYMENYLRLQKMRYNKRLSYNIHIDDSIVNCKVPKLILQPIIENSVKHGIENTEHLAIHISIGKVAGNIEIVVEDNGQGIEEERLVFLRRILEDDNAMPEHIGLYNVHRILKLLYGDSYGLTIESKYGIGTKVILKIPIIGDEIDA